MRNLKYSFLALMFGMFMIACSDDDKTPGDIEDDLDGIVVMAKMSDYDGQTVTSLDGTLYNIVENDAQEIGIMTDYAWFTLEYVQTPEAGIGINVNLKAIEYTQVNSIVEIEDVTAANDGIIVSEVTVDEDGIATLNIDYIGGKTSHFSELAFDSASYEDDDIVVLNLIYDANEDMGNIAMNSVAQFNLKSLNAEIVEGTSLVIKYTDIDGLEQEIETNYKF